MPVNKELAISRGLSDDDIARIEDVHERIDGLMNVGIRRPGMWAEEQLEEHITALDYVLQYLWGFQMDKSRHRYLNEYRFKKQWFGRKIKCVSTGEVFTIPFEVRECDFFKVGDGFIDVGRLDAYCRMAGVVEVSDD